MEEHKVLFCLVQELQGEAWSMELTCSSSQLTLSYSFLKLTISPSVPTYLEK